MARHSQAGTTSSWGGFLCCSCRSQASCWPLQPRLTSGQAGSRACAAPTPISRRFQWGVVSDRLGRAALPALPISWLTGCPPKLSPCSASLAAASREVGCWVRTPVSS